MIAVNYTKFRNEMKAHMDLATEGYEPIIVTRKNDNNVVILSEESYNNLLENMHLLESTANIDWLMKSKKQYEDGRLNKRSLAEVGDE